MPTIVDMTLKRRRPERFLVRLDSEEELILSPEIVLKHQLSPGRELSWDELVPILQEDAIRRAKDQMLSFLGRRPHSRSELVRKTLERGYSADAIDAALADLERVGLVDDDQYARLFAQNELTLRPCGRRLLAEKLRQRGIAASLIDTVLDDVYARQSAEALLRDQVERFLRKQRGKTRDRKFTEKLIRFLQGRGFEWEQISWVLHDSGIDLED